MVYKNTLISFLIVLAIINVLQSKAQTPTLWGMTSGGGLHNLGTIYSYEINTGNYNIQYSFDSSSGIFPNGALIQANDGYLYGMTSAGGVYNEGTIFKYSASTGVFHVLHDFGNPIDSDGTSPLGSLFQADNGLLYGMTKFGRHNEGVFFSYNIITSEYVHVHNFVHNISDGSEPVGAIMQVSNGLLYGVTSGWGGSIFSYSYNTGIFKIVHHFTNTGMDGAYPMAGLVQANDSLLLGTTSSGFTNLGGTIFNYNTYTDSESTLYNFSDYSIGQSPEGSLIKANDGLFYGTVAFGGADSVGILFSYDLARDTLIDIHNFGPNHDGVNPFGSLIQGSNGLLYGTTAYGGQKDSGTMFSYNISTGQEIVLHNFGGNNDGYYLYGDLVEVDFPTAVYEVSRPNQLKLYPNPINDKLNIEIEGNSSTSSQISITDISGKVVEREYINNADKIKMDVSSLSSGMYFVTVQTDGQRWVRKFVKQ